MGKSVPRDKVNNSIDSYAGIYGSYEVCTLVSS